MAVAAVDNRHHLQSWQFPMPQHHDPRPSFQYAQPPAPPPAEAPLPPRNEKELTRDMLVDILTFFSTLIPSRFNGAPVRLVVHGGACMLLHPGLYSLAQQQPPPPPSSSNSPRNSLPRRTTTRDVDYINRSFAYEWHKAGFSDATERLKDCMKVTAQKFRLGLDWMNSDADVALPMADDPTTGQRYDPIYTAALQPNNVHLHTVFTSPNGMLTLISVTPFWSVALKLVRYTKWDPGDICLLLRNGTNLSGTQWSTHMIENWLFQHCWPMGYSSYDPTRMRDMRSRIVHAIQMLSSWGGTVAQSGNSVTADAAMGGSDDPSSRATANPGFIPPPAKVQREAPRWVGPAQFPASHSQAPSMRKSIPSLAQDEWPLSVPMPRPKSHSHSHTSSHIPAHPHSHTQPHPHPHSHPPPQPQAHPHRASMSMGMGMGTGPGGWNPQADAHVRQFDSHIESMLHASAHREGAVPPSTEPAVIPTVTLRRKRDKQRDADRKKDRFSKWFGGEAAHAGAALGSDDEGSEDEWGRQKGGREWDRDRDRGRGEKVRDRDRMDQEDRYRGVYQEEREHHRSQQVQQQQQSQQQFHRPGSHSFSHPQDQPASRSRPSQQQQQQQQHSSSQSQSQSQGQGQARPPAWHHIYAQPHTTQPPASQPLATIDSNRQRSRSANPRSRHRPSSLLLEPLDELASSVTTLGIF